MEIFTEPAEMQEYAGRQKAAGSTIGLVPTMGALHEGHLSLMRAARAQCDLVIASVFVNPAQFGPQEDFAKYPRQFDLDCRKLESVPVDAVFHPEAESMYPSGFAAYVSCDGDLTQKLCGARRPGHFRGVATVVTKLLQISRADKAFFGQKDAQQVAVIRRVVEDLNIPAVIEMVPIVRESDGLARSSRNMYLNPSEREAATVLYRSLTAGRQAFRQGERDSRKILAAVRQVLAEEKLARIDYADMYTFPALQPVQQVENRTLLAIAVQIGQTRLIDNIILEAEAR